MNIVVLAGGLSTERCVFQDGGYGNPRHFVRNGHNVILLDVLWDTVTKRKI